MKEHARTCDQIWVEDVWKFAVESFRIFFLPLFLPLLWPLRASTRERGGMKRERWHIGESDRHMMPLLHYCWHQQDFTKMPVHGWPGFVFRSLAPAARVWPIDNGIFDHLWLLSLYIVTLWFKRPPTREQKTVVCLHVLFCIFLINQLSLTNSRQWHCWQLYFFPAVCC